MAITINSNSVASTAAMHLARNNSNLEKSLSRLSSGTKLVDSSSDPGGLAVSMKLSAAINRQTAAITNVQNAISFVQLQDGDLKAAASIVDRMASLRSMYDDVTKSDIDKGNYNTEFQSLRVQLFDATESKFNGVSLFAGGSVEWGSAAVGTTSSDSSIISVLTSERGSSGSVVSLAKIQLLSAVTVRVNNNTALADGTTGTAGDNMSVGNYKVQTHTNGQSLAADEKGTTGDVSLGSFTVDSFILALQNVATLRAENGATSSRLRFASDQLEAAKVNMESARSRIVDTDVASESTAFARYSILVQAGAAMLSQANNTQASVMQMLLL